MATIVSAASAATGVGASRSVSSPWPSRPQRPRPHVHSIRASGGVARARRRGGGVDPRFLRALRRRYAARVEHQWAARAARFQRPAPGAPTQVRPHSLRDSRPLIAETGRNGVYAGATEEGSVVVVGLCFAFLSIYLSVVAQQFRHPRRPCSSFFSFQCKTLLVPKSDELHRREILLSLGMPSQGARQTHRQVRYELRRPWGPRNSLPSSEGAG